MAGAPTIYPGARPVSPVQPSLIGFTMSPLVGEPGATNDQVSSKRRLAVVDVALAENIGDNTINRLLCRRRNINSFLAKSPAAIEIVDGDISQQTEVVDLHHSGDQALWLLVLNHLLFPVMSTQKLILRL